MSSFQDVQTFVRAVRTAPSLTDIGLVLKDATRAFQFDHFALAQRINAPDRLGPVRLTDFPDHWVDNLVPSGRVADDPVLLACERSVTPFTWSRLDSIMPLSSRHKAYMTQARAAGLAEGYTVPIHVPGQASGLVSFVMAQGRELPSDSLPAAQYLACFAFEAARRLKAMIRPKDRSSPSASSIAWCWQRVASPTGWRASCSACRAARSTNILRPPRRAMALPPAPNWWCAPCSMASFPLPM